MTRSSMSVCVYVVVIFLFPTTLTTSHLSPSRIKKRSLFVFFLYLAIDRCVFLSLSTAHGEKKNEPVFLFHHCLQLRLDRMPLSKLARQAPAELGRSIFIVIFRQSINYQKFFLNSPLSPLRPGERFCRD